MDYNIAELLVLVKELTDSYTSKESTSITYEAAQQLMGAVLYCIQENDLAFENDPAETILVKQSDFPTAREAYGWGYRLVVDKIKKANEIYNDIIVDFQGYGNHAYYDTVVKGIPEFFLWYDPRLNPTNHIILMDYNVLEPLQDMEGIDLIYRYLLYIRMEQKFLKQFPEEFIREALYQYHSDYEELFINICGIILKRVLVNMLIGAKLEKVHYETADYEKLSETIHSLNKEELKEELSFHLERLIYNINCSDIYFKDINLNRYLSIEMANISAELRNAASNNCLYNTI